MSATLLVLPRRQRKTRSPLRSPLRILFERRRLLISIRADLERLEREWDDDREAILSELAAVEQ